MNSYEESARRELRGWQRQMEKAPTLWGRYTKGLQVKINNLIPEKAHGLITAAIRGLVHAALVGSEYTTSILPAPNLSLEERERQVFNRLDFYKKTAAAEGAGTGAGGILLGLADFPLLLGIKLKFLFETAALYGFDVRQLSERLYILHLFQLAFSSEIRRQEVYAKVANWPETVKEFPADLDSLDWRTFQQEYRDYIDLAKLLQLIPGIGAVVGAYANYRLLDKLGETAINGYRLRIFSSQ